MQIVEFFLQTWIRVIDLEVIPPIRSPNIFEMISFSAHQPLLVSPLTFAAVGGWTNLFNTILDGQNGFHFPKFSGWIIFQKKRRYLKNHHLNPSRGVSEAKKKLQKTPPVFGSLNGSSGLPNNPTLLRTQSCWTSQPLKKKQLFQWKKTENFISSHRLWSKMFTKKMAEKTKSVPYIFC